jgi:hypothetical protein
MEVINGGLWIFNNDVLWDISGLENLDGNQLEELIIGFNPALSECSIQSICTFLETGSEALIEGNMTGCATVEEVKEGCETGIEDPYLSADVIIHPNPATDIIHITIPSEETINSIRIYNSSGQLLKHRTSNETTIDVSMLKAGTYIFEVKLNGNIARKLIIKQD